MDAAFAESMSFDTLNVPSIPAADVENIVKDEPGSTMVPSSTLIEVLTWAMGDYRGRVAGNDKALTYSAVWACVRIISQALSMVGWHVFETEGKGKRKIDQAERTAAGDLAWYLNTQPNSEQTSVDWRQACLADALQFGNGYSFIDKDPVGRIRQLWRIDHSRVKPKRLGGNFVYVVSNGPDMDPDVLTPDQVLHFKGLGDGLVGYSVVEMARRTIELGLSQENFGATFFERGPMPGGILEMPGNPKEEDRKQFRDGFERAYGGAKNAGRVIALSGGSKFTPLSLSHQDSQFLESRRFSVEEVSRWFGVPPHMLASLDRATFSNIEHQRIEFVQDCLLPWARRIEAEADIKLFGRVNRGRYWTKLNLAALLRGDTASQTASLQTKVTSGIMQLNEAREELDLNPIADGDTTLVQGAMIPLERALNPPEPPKPIAPPVAPKEEPEDDEPAAKALWKFLASLRNEAGEKTEVVVIAGPPAAGKSTWVESERKTGDVVVDWDSLRASLMGGPRRGGDFDCLDIIAGARDGACDAIRDGLAAGVKHPRCFIVRALPNGEDRAKFAADLDAKQVLVLCDESTSIDRIKADEGRKEYEAEQIDAVKRWHKRYTSHAGDVVVRTDGKQASDEPPANLASAIVHMFSGTCSRLLRVEADKARRANNRGELEKWRKGFYDNDESTANEYLGDVKATLAAFSMNPLAADRLSFIIANAHNNYGMQSPDLLKALTDKEWPTQFAKECVKILWRNRQ